MNYRIFDTLLEPVFVIDSEKKVLYCNEPAALICELSVRKITRGQIFDEILKFETTPLFLQTLTELNESSPYQELNFESTASGKTGKVQLTAQPVPHTHTEKPAWLVFFRDVTLEETLQKKYRAELEQVQHYSKNLEKMVDERTAQIKKLNETMSALLDSLGQGFFIFNSEGLCLDVFSRACTATVEAEPPGRKVWDVLGLDQKQVPGFQKWLMTVFAEMLPFEDLSPLAPQTFAHSEGRHIQLEYYPLKTNEGTIEGVVVVATDVTNLVEARREAEVERAYAKMIVNLVKNKRQVAGFLREAQDLLAGLKSELQKNESLDPDTTFRFLHTLKGGASSFSIKSMADICHEAETTLSQFKWDGVTAAGVEKLSHLSEGIDSSFQNFKKENQVILGAAAQSQERWIEAPVSRFTEYRKLLEPQSKVLADQFTQQFLTEPIGHFFEYFNEVVQNVAVNEGKQVAPLTFENSDLAITPEPYENLFSTFIHSFRNSVDHGIESPTDRETAGKNPEGHITVSFSKTSAFQREHLLIQIKDDGRGVDAEKIRTKLQASGVDTSKETNEQLVQHIFDSQFSTKDAVTETSGRGVGMDAIQFAAQKLGGKAWVKSTPGQGTTLFVQVPWLTAAPENLKLAV
jgi:two-component system, chemotaxis family, sensor kinase CheA